MQQRTNKVSASEETIKIGPLGIRFLLTGDDSNGSVSVLEVLVPVGQKLAAPAHKNDAYAIRRTWLLMVVVCVALGHWEPSPRPKRAL